MFERNRVETFDRGTGRDKIGHAVELTLADGRVLSGQLITQMARGISDLLNAPGGFVEFESAAGERSFIAKSTITAVAGKHFPRTDQLERKLRQAEGFDAYATLGLARTAGREAVRDAYLKLAKAYHPDRIQSLALPAEIVEYSTAMAKRINAAYSALTESDHPRAEAAARPAPTSAN